MKSVITVFLGLALLVLPHLSFPQESTLPQKPSCADIQGLASAKIRELEALPLGISVVHNPASVKATHDPIGSWPYKWTYVTTVSSLAGVIEIEEFGMLGWNGKTWMFSNYTGAPFTSSDFASWYTCPNGLLRTGTVFVDPKNWSANRDLKDHVALWYFIGVDSSGKRVKGQAIVHQMGQLVEG
jgi:hypothetical protein